MNVLIVEDEIFAQKELQRLLLSINPAIKVVENCDSVEAAVEWLKSNKPDLILMDIQLADGQSFEIFNQIEVKSPVIFTTAYDEFAIQAFKVNSIDYLLKPIEKEHLETALKKYAALHEEEKVLSAAQIQSLLNQNRQSYKTRFMVQIGERIRFVTEDEIAYFKADDEVVYLFTNDQKKYIVNVTLEQLDPQLDPKWFFRINRSYIARISSIGEIHKYFNSRLKLQLVPDPKEEILVSRVKVPLFLKWIDN